MSVIVVVVVVAVVVVVVFVFVSRLVRCCPWSPGVISGQKPTSSRLIKFLRDRQPALLASR